MLIGTVDSSVLGYWLTGKNIIRADEDPTSVDHDFNATSSFNKFWNTKLLTKWT